MGSRRQNVGIGYGKLRRDEQTGGTYPMSNLSIPQDSQKRRVKKSYGICLRNGGMCVRSSL